ncbi:unnamed protein product [Coffea canephora]|uniref:thymidine kinase n=1 Tax=Coffea canephora TaxID=49390 RepID=A0A068VFQ2_COFCA|nr:unnamed protein product [Coffea canephora]
MISRIKWVLHNTLFCHHHPIKSPSFLLKTPVKNPRFWLLNQQPSHQHCQIRSLKSEATSAAAYSSSGEIHVIVGPMFAGKTSILLRRIRPRVQKVLMYVGFVLYYSAWVRAVLIICHIKTKKKISFRLYNFCKYMWVLHEGWIQVYNCRGSSRIRNLNLAHTLFFNKLQMKSLVSWNLMIAGYVQKGLEEVGLSMFHKLRKNGLTPDHYTFAPIFRACVSLAILEEGRQAHALRIRCQICGNLVVNSALMDMYFKCSRLSVGHLVFGKFLDRNVVTWSALISGYGQHGRVVEVMESLHRMLDEGFSPNHVTFLAVLAACNHGGLVNRGWEYFTSVTRDCGIQPKGKHYVAMVDLLGRAGRLVDAYEFVMNSPFKELPFVWGALLGACKIHGNMDSAKLAAKNFFELEPKIAGKYVVLSNAYASFGSWDNVAELRSVMNESEMKTEGGSLFLCVVKNCYLIPCWNNMKRKLTCSVGFLSKEIRKFLTLHLIVVHVREIEINMIEIELSFGLSKNF